MKHLVFIWSVILLCSFTAGEEKTIWLGDMDLSLFDLETGQAMKNQTTRGDTIIIAGTIFQNGVGVGVPAKYLIDLNSTGSRFYAEVGACDRKFRPRPAGSAPGGPGIPGGAMPGGGAPGGAMPGGVPRMMPTIEFFVLGDQKVIWSSGEMKTGDKAKVVDVEIGGIKKMALVVVSK
ncbi:MAG: NPCBM/NEW2 domain-containing protein, partial [Mariniphaga sp.]